MPLARMVTCAAIALVAAFVLALPVAPAHAAADRLAVGIQDPLDPVFGEQDPFGAFRVLRERGVTFARVPVSWASIAPQRPAEPSNPADPAYLWTAVDARVRRISEQGLAPLLSLYVPPRWALRDASAKHTPRIADFASFVTAIAQHYSGRVAGVPRVRHWEIWNEPNLDIFLDARDNVNQYRALVNAAYPRIHSAAAGNVVAAGGLAPAPFTNHHAPMQFMRDLLCVTSALHSIPRCPPILFDAWSLHPYTSGGPNHRSSERDNVTLGDLPAMNSALRAGQRTGHVKPSRRVSIWVTEFSWDTKGPDPGGVPVIRHARWVGEALYRLWAHGVSLVTWFQLRDNPKQGTWGHSFQAGLYYRTTHLYSHEKAKPVAQVIRFPFVALPQGRGVTVWGRTPGSRSRPVTIDQRRGSRWVRVTSASSNRYGIFRVRLRSGSGRTFRARAGRLASFPFAAVRTRDVYARPFGGP